MNHSPSIRLIDLSTGYTTPKRQIVIANRINATINQGELTCLLGANGAGKSTLLRTLSGFQPPLVGEIQLMGKSLKAYSDKQLARVIGVVLTDKCEIRNMSVMELVGLGRSPYTGFWGTLGETDREIVHQALVRVKIERFARRMIQTLSDGERQKVMIAKALAQETPIIFLDEPTAFLDFPSKVEIMQLLHELSRGMGKTVFMSTHDLELALQIADKIWLMDREKGLRVGTPEDLALDGALDHFFEREGVAFDEETGLFRIDHTFQRVVRLEGEGSRYAMARKALARNGIQAERGLDASLTIRCGATPGAPFTIITPDGEKEVRTIEELLRLVD